MSTLTEYKCPNCGGAVEFNIGAQTMKCPYCDSEFNVEALEAENELKQGTKPDEMSWNNPSSDWGDEQNGLKVYSCNSCGGEVICDETTTATKCPYCDNNVTIKGAFEGDYRPDIVIPFKLDKDIAKKKYQEHISGKPFLPADFKDENHIDEIKGVYVPEWLFDCNTYANVMYDATRTRSWSDSKNNYVETSHFDVFRAGSLAFTGIPVDGSSKMDDDLMESIEPFDLSQGVDFKAAYLAGYLSDKYDVGIEQSTPRANERIRQSAVDVLRSTVNGGYASVVEKSSNVNNQSGRVRYALYPVWLLNTTYKNQKYTFAMNGQTGKMVGDLPVDKPKLYKFATAIGLAVSVVSSIIAYLFL